MKIEVLFFTGIDQIKIPRTPKNGERFLDRFYITSDSEKITHLLHPFRAELGSVEYDYLRGKCPALIYAIDHLDVDMYHVQSPNFDSMCIRELRLVQGFLRALWMVQDNAAFQDRGWLVAHVGGKNLVHNNSWNVRHSTSSGRFEHTSFTLDQLKMARHLSPVDGDHLGGSGQPTALTSTSLRFQRFDYFIQSARSCSDVAIKIAQYCSGIEALVSSSASELTHQVAERVACLLDAPGESRLERFKKLKNAYAFRSRAVHGASFKAKAFDELRTVSSYVDDVCRQLAVLYTENRDGIREQIEGSDEDFNDFFQRRIFFISSPSTYHGR